MKSETAFAADLVAEQLDRIQSLASASVDVVLGAAEGRRRSSAEELVLTALVEIARRVDALRSATAEDPRDDPEWWSAGCLR